MAESTNNFFKIPVIVRPDYIFYIENVNGACFMHCDVLKWNTAVFKQLKQDWNTFSELHGGPLFCVKEQDTTGYKKFIKSLGFKFYKEVQDTNQNKVYIYYWSE